LHIVSSIILDSERIALVLSVVLTQNLASDSEDEESEKKDEKSQAIHIPPSHQIENEECSVDQSIITTGMCYFILTFFFIYQITNCLVRCSSLL